MPPGKPPIGVMPQFLWDEQHPDPSHDDYMERAFDLEAAIVRYLEADMLPRIEWVKELSAVSFFAGDSIREPFLAPAPSAN